jgi:hypothetical protein
VAAERSLPIPGASADSNHASLQSSQNFFSDIGANSAYKLNGFIVTVPDPARTRLALWFDRDVDSIVAAASDQGYSLDHFWLPWTDKPPEPEPDCYWQLQAMSEIRRREQEPGLITFRKTPTDDSPSFLLVFLVGESPIWGIDKLQFRNAVKHLKDAGAYSLCLANGCQIDVVGPSFSGSASSLASAVETSLQGINFSIISTTATGPDALNQLSKLCENPKSHCVKFAHGLNEDDETEYEFVQFLKDRGLVNWDPVNGVKIGLISESETVYGREFGVTTKKDKGQLAASQLIPFSFPRNISRLREAYGQNSQVASSSNASNNPLPRQLLPLVLNVPESEEESPPEFAKQHTPLSQEMEMAALAERLREDQVRLAVIAATDPLDTIFVMQFLHRRDPELQFAVFDSDLLFLRADDEVPPEGLLSVSPHPLLASREILREQGSSMFPSNYAQTEYEACLQALPPDRTGDSGPKDSKFSSSLWLTVVGRTGYWPVSLLGADAAKPPVHSLYGMSIPRVWLVVWETVNFLWGLYVLFFWAAQYLNRRTLENFRLLDRREDPFWKPLFRVRRRLIDRGEGHFWKVLFRIRQGSSEDDRAHRPYVMMRSFYLLISMVALWLIRALLLFPAIRAYGWAAKLSFLVFVPLTLTTLFLLLVVIVLAVVQRTRAGAYYAVMALVAAGAAFTLGRWWYIAANPANSYGLFLCYRSVSLTSGVSPVVPLALLLLAVGIWAWRQLDSMAVGIRRPYLPAAGVNSHFRLLDERIQTTLHQAVFNWPAQALALGSVILVWWITHVGQSRLMSVERSSFTLCFQLLLFIVLWLVFDQWLRFCVVWIDLRGVLERLEQLRFREAFTRLPKQFSGAAIWQQGAPRRSYKLLTRSIDSLTALDTELQLGEKDSLTALDTELQPGEKELTEPLPNLRKELARISKSEARGTCPSPHGLEKLQKSLCSTAEKIASSLSPKFP